MSEVTAIDFLASLGVAQLPSGKRIYFAQAAAKHLNFLALQEVVWKAYDKSGKFIRNIIQHKNTRLAPSLPLAASYITKDGTAWFSVDLDKNGTVMQTSVDKTKFDLSPLETLPSVASDNAVANQLAKDANIAATIARQNFTDQLIDSLGLKKLFFYLGGGLLVLFGLNKVLK